MARFVLVHGGFSGAWIWLPLMDGLKAAGHLVETFDLPGTASRIAAGADRPHRAPTRTEGINLRGFGFPIEQYADRLLPSLAA